MPRAHLHISFVLTALFVFAAAGCGGSSTAIGSDTTPDKKSPGAACADGGECASGFCRQDPVGGGSVCSDCAADADCPQATETCEWNAVSGHYYCAGPTLAGLGDACAANADCASGFCFDAGGGPGQICSTCSAAADCGAQRDCVFDPTFGFASCVGTIALGDNCQNGDQCLSGACRGNVCSECERDSDCIGGGTCLDDMAGVGYFVCTGGYGDTCTGGADCGSGFCYDAGGGPGQVCSECENQTDCGAQQDCSFSGADGYASCVGTGNFGDTCTTGAECVSGFCNTGVCSQCEIDADCGGGTCADDSAGLGFWLCTLPLGDACNTNAQCDSGFCFDPPGGGPLCSECEVAGDCGVQRDCVFSGANDYAICVGTGNLGDSCTSGDQCVSTSCNCDVCS